MSRPSTNDNKPTSLFQDSVFATLMDMFGDTVAPDVIQGVGSTRQWNLNACIEQLIHLTDSSDLVKITTQPSIPDHQDLVGDINDIRISYRGSSVENEGFNDDADVLIESEELQSDLLQPYQTVQPVPVAQRPQPCSGTIPKTTKKLIQPPIQYNCSPQRPAAKATPVRQEIIPRIVEQLHNGLKVMILMRGAPGCGKTYLAHEIVDMAIPSAKYSNHIFSSDDFFYDRHNRYRYDSYRIPDAHEFNQKRVAAKAASGWSPIVVDNTNIRVWEMYAYVTVAVTHGYVVEILEPTTPWARSAGKLAQRNKHNVPKDRLEKMLQNYEPATVAEIMRQIKVHYTMPMPQLRSNPTIKQLDAISEVDNLEFRNRSSPAQTIEWGTWKPSSVDLTKPILNDNLEVAIEEIRSTQNDWVSYDRNDFWKISNDDVSKQEPLTVPLETKTEEPNIMTILKEDLFNASPSEEIKNNETVTNLVQHRKDCRNENESFSQIRQIYPAVPLAYLWDLFKNCNGDGDWTMDILLKEDTRVNNYVDLSIDNFVCHCDGNVSNERIPNPLPTQNIQQDVVKSSPTQANAKLRREKIPKPNRVDIRRQIEGNFVISDEHYSEHTLKIRNIRLGVPPPILDSIDCNLAQSVETNCLASNNNPTIDSPKEPSDADDMLEVNLGIELISQLDTAFGIDAFQREHILKDMKTTVFMPTQLAQQLYAIWMESLYNQLEEQRQRSIREDEEFARQINEQQKFTAQAASGSGSEAKSNIQDLVDMELAWSAYRKAQTDDEWQSPHNLATKMTHDKLFDTFPNIAQDTLVEVLAANHNNYKNTIGMLKQNGAVSSPVTNTAEKNSRKTIELMEKAKIEVESAPAATVHRSESSKALELKKLGPVESKRLALREFEDSRNKAMHHTQLKAECYTKAKDAIQKGHTSVAVYYSQIANLHKNKIDIYNNQAANCIMEVHNLTNNNPDMLDLHYLHLMEAIQCLDIFIDKHIDRLRVQQQSHKHILVITGRGLHSAGGFSTIKQRTKLRLRERNLTWNEMNPGLLRIKIYTNSWLTMNL